MANRFSCVFGAFLLFITALLVVAGCETAADDDIPPPGFARQTLNPPPPAPPLLVAPRQPVANPPMARVQPPRANRPQVAAGAIPADWIPRVPANHWQWIVIHHTATSFGNAAIVTRWHIDRGFDEMGYHFLIGNGTNSGDGQIEVGTRWPKQKWGAHTKSPDNRFNDFGIGICLVGNFDVGYPTAAQMRSLDKLVAYLMKTYHIPPERVLGHNDCKSTDCPGKHLNVAIVRHNALAILADEGETFGEDARLASSHEMIHDAPAK